MKYLYSSKRSSRSVFTSVMLGLLIALMPLVQVSAQSAQVSGKVVSSDGDGLPGVNVIIKGVQEGTITDINGDFKIQVPDENAVLVFSFVGYNTREVTVGKQRVFSVELSENVEELSEVVVTALGIKREERSLGFSVGRVDGEEMNRVAQENVLSALSGKVAGVSINQTSGAGSSVSMVIRGASSLSSDNQPLFVIDGVPVVNTLNNVTQIGDRNPVDYGNAISDLNPADIESVSVLKGPSAAALYGSRAGNGVVLITTKSGSKSKGMKVSVTTNTVFDMPYRYLDFHSKFATGVQPYTPDNNPYPGGQLIIDEGSAAGAGPELDKGHKAIQWNSPLDENGNPIPTELVSYPNNVANFVQTGITTTNGVALSNSNDLMNYRVGFTNMSSRGLVPNSDLFRNNFTISSSMKALKNLTVSSNVNINRSWSNNRPAGNRGTNPLQAAYAVSPHINILELKDYWVPGQEGLQQRSQAIGDYDNPYFLAYEINNSFNRDRVFGNLKADWQITPELSLMGRYSLDYYTEMRQTRGANSYTRDRNGIFGIVNLMRYERNADFLLTYSKDFNKLGLTLSAGGNARYDKGTNVLNSTKRNAGLVVPGVYTLSNISAETLNYNSSWYQRGVHSLYGVANFSYDDMVYLDLTARKDWSSTLPAGNNSYFYPSVSLSFLVNEMVDMGSNVDMLKLRGGWAKVGNDANPYSLFPTLYNAGQWSDVTRLGVSGTLLTPDLKPEEATSFEYGVDLGMFNNRLRFEGTIYSMDNKNQILRGIGMPPSSGFDSKNINAGLISSKGWELMIGGTPIKNVDGITWDISTNITRNRTKIEELAEGMELYTLWTDAKGGAWTYVGETIGDIYDRKLVVVEDESSPYHGYPILSSDGSWQDINANNTKNKIGNFNPDFIAGFQTALSYKAFSLNMTLDWRSGGQFVSQTYRYGESDMKTQRWLDQLIHPGDRTGDALRDWLVENEDTMIKDGINIVGGPTKEYGGFETNFVVPMNDGVFNPGVIAQYDGQGNIIGYTENLGGPGTKILPYAGNYAWDFTKTATFDADYVKIREVSLSYQLPSSLLSKIGVSSANVALYSRNIMLWTKAGIGIDPEMAFQPEGGTQGSGIQFKQGIERYNVNPWVIPVGFKLGLTF